MDKDGVRIAEYFYDYQGLRYKKVDYVNGKTTIYIYGAGTEPIHEEVYNNSNLTTVLSKSSYLNMGNRRVVRTEGDVISYYFSDDWQFCFPPNGAIPEWVLAFLSEAHSNGWTAEKAQIEYDKRKKK